MSARVSTRGCLLLPPSFDKAMPLMFFALNGYFSFFLSSVLIPILGVTKSMLKLLRERRFSLEEVSLPSFNMFTFPAEGFVDFLVSVLPERMSLEFCLVVVLASV